MLNMLTYWTNCLEVYTWNWFFLTFFMLIKV